MTDDRYAVICKPTENYSPAVPNSTREYCEICATEVWLSPASRVAGGGAPMVVCVDCAPGVMKTEETKPILLRPTAEQLRELHEYGRRRADG
jgi:ribosome-binding protein aMBF1 (putative translation factor)